MNLNLAKSYIDMAELLANQSKCVKASVGALVIKDGRIISSGVNGTPSGHINCCDLFDERAKNENSPKFKEHKEWSSRNEIHAEVNALTKAGSVEDLQDKIYVVVNKMPCEQCQKMIALYRPIAVYYRDIVDTIPSDSILYKAGIVAIKVDPLHNVTVDAHSYFEFNKLHTTIKE